MNRDIPSTSSKKPPLLIHLLHRFPPSTRGHIVAIIGEFTGTIFFLFFAFAGTQVANISSNPNFGTEVNTTTYEKTPQQLLYIALSFGFSLVVNAWVYFRISGGLFNPAVTLGLYLIHAITLTRCIFLFTTQLLASIVATALVRALTPGDLNILTTLSPTISLPRALFLEMFLTAQLVFAIFMLASEQHTGTFLAPIGIGLSLFIAELVGVFWTGGSCNPARSFGPAVVAGSFEGSHWVYWVGPLGGTVLAWGLYGLVKGLEYESVGPEAGGDEGGRARGEVDARMGMEAVREEESKREGGGIPRIWRGSADLDRVERRDEEKSEV